MTEERLWQKEERAFYSCRIQIRNARPWSAETPYLYQLEIRLLEDKKDRRSQVIDEITLPVGICLLSWSAETGLLANGKEVKLCGACLHHDNGMLGAAEWREAVYRKLGKLKELGYNAVRTAHNPPSQIFLQACDELGLYVMTELTDVWQIPKNEYDDSMYFRENWKQSLEAMVRKAGSHPCVVMYSIGNEVTEVTRQKGAKWNRVLAEELRRLDASKPITNCINLLCAKSAPSGQALEENDHSPEEVVEPCRTGEASPMVRSQEMNMLATMLPKMLSEVTAEQVERNLGEILEPLDLIGMNYGTHLSEAMTKQNPERLIVHAETYPAVIGKTWPVTMRCRHVVGDFMWTGCDYLGEAGLGVHPLDRTGQECHRSPWRGTDVIESWDWQGCEGKAARVELFAAGKEVELWQDGVCLGRKPLLDFAAAFEVTYQKGCLEAVSFGADGSELGRSRLRSSRGKTTLQIQPEKQVLKADEQALVYVRVILTGERAELEQEEKQSRKNETSERKLQEIRKIVGTRQLEERQIRITIEGCGTLVAVGSGNPATEERYDGDCFTTWHGSMMAIIRSKKTPGRLFVRAEADGLERACVELEAV